MAYIAEAVFGQADFTTVTAGIQRNKFNNPAGITLDGGGNLWVADNINNRAAMFQNAATKASGADADGLLGAVTFIVNPSGNTDGQMRQPQDIAVDGSGRVWVADWQNHRILRFDNGAADAIANGGCRAKSRACRRRPRTVGLWSCPGQPLARAPRCAMG